MAFSPRQRQIALGSALVLTLALVFWMSKTPEESAPEVRDKGESTVPAAKAPPPASRPAAGDAMASLKLGRGEPTDKSAGAPAEIRNLFAQQTWVKPPPAADAGPPQAPPLPFTYLGKLIDQGRITLYLASAERNLTVRQGDVIDGTYRVKRITPVAASFIYIPMNQLQTLDIGRNK